MRIEINPYLIRKSRMSSTDRQEVERFYSYGDKAPEESTSKWDTWGSRIILVVAVLFFVYMGWGIR